MSDALTHARQLLARAHDDAYVIARLADEPGAPAWVLGFHAQQAVEKTLKAVLTLRGQVYPRTHNLVLLAQALEDAGLLLPQSPDALATLVPYGVALRYDALDEDEPRLDRGALRRQVDWWLAWAQRFVDGAGA